jgi:hypothetical protein
MDYDLPSRLWFTAELVSECFEINGTQRTEIIGPEFLLALVCHVISESFVKFSGTSRLRGCDVGRHRWRCAFGYKPKFCGEIVPVFPS